MDCVSQLTLDLPVRKTFTREDFFVAACNSEAVTWLDMHPHWPSHALMIVGPQGSGKTHLAHLFAKNHIEACDLTDDFLPEKIERLVVENLETLTNEAALFHLFNWTKERGIRLLITARKVPDFVLPDLASRLALVPKVPIHAPDDEMIYTVLMRGFQERGVIVEPAVLEYALKRLPRSFPAIQKLIEEADALSLAAGRSITIPMLRPILESR